jgi:hypothetical protein
MSLTFRPVQEIWGTASSCFVGEPAEFLEAFAELAGCGPTERHPYAECTSVWISDGSKFLDALEATEFPPSLFFSDRFLKGDGDTTGLASLWQNLKALAGEWRGSLNTDGSLVFYIDVY